ncbi:uncharacterized protein LOC135118573 [Helicoverpa armigera]|uniref:uncharacterized protein LOC135118573 n=1 Tax=Helicoverpa armigera TaxID=29058 RepID=UPI00308306D3
MSFPVYFMCAASDLNSLLISIYLISIFGRMKLLKKTLENNLVPVNIVGKEQLDKNVNIVRKCVGYYTNMIDAWNIIDNDMQIMKLKSQLDPSLSSELEVVLHCIHIRPFKFLICRAVPVDINMPITIISFCITYVIVIMQFIHFSNL